MTERLQKVLANRGLASRRKIEQWISAGRIKVNGKLATLGLRVELSDRIEVDGRKLEIEESVRTRVLIYNKKEGEICSHDDDQGRRDIYQNLPALEGGKWISIGRLDINTSGLILLTTDGQLAYRYMHPKYNIEREYAVRVIGEVTDVMIRKLTQGVHLDGRRRRFTAIQAGVKKTGLNHWYHVVLKEGCYREVRRLWESQGIRVNRLKRVRYGSITLPVSLEKGQWSEMSAKQMKNMMSFVDY